MSDESQSQRNGVYWRRTVRIALFLLAAWFLATSLPLTLSAQLAQSTILGWPASFAVVAFAVPLLYLLIIGLYCILMDRVERTESGPPDV